MGMIADELDRDLIPLDHILQIKIPIPITGAGFLTSATNIMGSVLGPMIGAEVVYTPVRDLQMEAIYRALRDISKAIAKLEARKSAPRPGTGPVALRSRPLPSLPSGIQPGVMPKQSDHVADKLDIHIAQLDQLLRMQTPGIAINQLPTMISTPFIDMQMEAILRTMKEVAKAIRKLEDSGK